MNSPSAVTFRAARSDDNLPAIVAPAREAHGESRYLHIPFSEAKVATLAQDAFRAGTPKAVFLAFKGAEPVGMAGVSVGEYMIGTDVRIASIHNVYVARTVRERLGGGKVALGLLQGVHRWAKAQGAAGLTLHGTAGVEKERLHRLAGRLGFQFAGGNYVAFA